MDIEKADAQEKEEYREGVEDHGPVRAARHASPSTGPRNLDDFFALPRPRPHESEPSKLLQTAECVGATLPDQTRGAAMMQEHGDVLESS